MKSMKPVLLLTLASTILPGCSVIHEEIIETETCVRNCILAQKAWGHWSWCYKDLDHPYHFSKGFKEGYQNILEGGSGCQPTLPPECYWKPCYETPEGHCKIHAWFDGFSHGALAAKQDGYGALTGIPISPRARENLRLANSKPVPLPGPVPHVDIHDPAAVIIDLPEATVVPDDAATGQPIPIPAPDPLKRPYDE